MGLKRSLRTGLRLVGLRPYYQEQRGEATEARWALIESRLTEADRSLLDIGCNVGAFTARAAARGMFALGLDPMGEAIARARRLNRDRAGLAFMVLRLDPRTVDALPAFDVTLCLSVHHRWSRAWGEERAWDMIGRILERTRTMFFEPASSHERYGRERPGFVANDEASIRDYVERNVARVSSGERRASLLGATASFGRESVRLMFLVR